MKNDLEFQLSEDEEYQSLGIDKPKRGKIFIEDTEL